VAVCDARHGPFGKYYFLAPFFNDLSPRLLKCYHGVASSQFWVLSLVRASQCLAKLSNSCLLSAPDD
jgi:hypothetical protein